MPEKLRSINTKFWNDPYIEELNPSEKLLFLYCLTSPYSNLLGIYEVSQKKISFETGLNQETIRKGFESFEKDSKIFYRNNYIIIPKHLSHQRLNSNMKVGVVKSFHELPEWLKEGVLGNDLDKLENDSESFEIIRNHLGTIRNPILKYERGKRKKEEGNRKDEEGNMKPSNSKNWMEAKKVLNEIYPYFDKEVIKNLTDKQKEEWIRTVERLNRIDGYDFEDIKAIIIWAKEDEFWSKNVLAVPPLREKKDGVSKFFKIIKAIKYEKGGSRNSKNQISAEKARGIAETVWKNFEKYGTKG